jgi:hypothetical protein
LETEFSEHGGHLTDGLVSGDSGERGESVQQCESSIDEHFEVETHRVGVQGGAHADLCHVQRGIAAA